MLLWCSMLYTTWQSWLVVVSVEIFTISHFFFLIGHLLDVCEGFWAHVLWSCAQFWPSALSLDHSVYLDIETVMFVDWPTSIESWMVYLPIPVKMLIKYSLNKVHLYMPETKHSAHNSLLSQIIVFSEVTTRFASSKVMTVELVITFTIKLPYMENIITRDHLFPQSQPFKKRIAQLPQEKIDNQRERWIWADYLVPSIGEPY